MVPHPIIRMHPSLACCIGSVVALVLGLSCFLWLALEYAR